MPHELSASLTQKIQRATVRQPLTIAMDAMVHEAIALMAEAALPAAASPDKTTPAEPPADSCSSCVIVVNKAQNVLGILTERDVIGLLANHQSLDELNISAVMIQPRLIIRETELNNRSAPIEQLQHTDIFPCPIVDDSDRLVGLITTNSWCRSQTALSIHRSATEASSQSNTIHPPQQSFIDSLPIGILQADATSAHHRTNTAWHQLTGISRHNPLPSAWQQQVHPDDRARVTAEWQSCQAENRPFKMEYRFQHGDGKVVWVQGQVILQQDANGQLQEPVLTLIDISDRKAAEAQLEAHNHLLAKILRDEPLNKILEGIIDFVKQQIKGPICSFLLIDEEGRLRYGAAPDHPQDYILQTDGAPTGEGIGSCGTAIARKETVIVTNIATDPLWADYKDIALKHGLLACWSHPVMASDGSALGTFALYYPEIRTPQPYELELVAQIAHMAGIAIERHQTITELAQFNQALERRVQDRTAALEASQMQFRQFAENLPGMVYRYVIPPDQRGHLDYVSYGIKEIYEIDLDDVKRNPQSLWESVYPEERETLQVQIAQSLKTLSPFFSEHRLVTPSGIKWVKSMARPTQQKNGDIFLDGMVIDISDCKAAEAALSQEVLRRTAIFNASLDGIHILNGNGDLLDANASFLEMLGYTAEEASQLNVADWDAKWNRQELQTLLKLPFLDGTVFETVHRRKDGSVFPVEVSRQDMAGEAQTSLVCISRNISERQKVETALEKSRQKYYSLIQSIDGIVWEYDLIENIYSFISNKVVDLLGYPIKSWMEESNFWENHVYPDDLERIKLIYEAGIKSQKIYDLEYRIIASDGSLVWIYEVITPLIDEAGITIANSGISINIGDRKAAELRLKQLNQELVRATQLKDEFLANMSHELRTPLNSIMGMAEGLKDEILGEINEKQLNALKIIENSSSHLLELINDILDVAKFESGQLQLNRVPVQIKSLCHSSLAFIKQPALSKKIRLQTNIASNIPALLLDQRRMRQVLINLLSNAVKFTPQGGSVNLTVNLIQPTSHSDQTTDTLSIEVEDTGIGIAPEDTTSLFQPFIQIDSALNRKFQGTGLGLTLVKQIVELHGGTVHLTSRLDEGSCFTIELPCSFAEEIQASHLSAEAVLSEPEPDASIAIASAPLILLAEDNDANITMISTYIQAKGYRLLVAKEGQAAIDLAQRHRPDLILMDIQMPGMDGLAAMANIRQISNLQKTPIIALTALAMKGDRDRCIEAGANDYLSKPVKLQQLSQMMQTQLKPKSD